MADDGIYFVTGTARYTLRFLSVRTGRRRILAKLDDHVIYLNLSPDGKSILYTQNEQAGSDLMLVEHFQWEHAVTDDGTLVTDVVDRPKCLNRVDSRSRSSLRQCTLARRKAMRIERDHGWQPTNCPP